MSEETETLAAQNAQRRAAKATMYATLEQMTGKEPAASSFTVLIGGKSKKFDFVAVGAHRYDEMLGECPPTTAQKARGLTYDPDTFSGLLLSEVCRKPAFSAEDWTKVLKSDGWSGGEVADFYGRANALCGKGLDPDPTEAG